MTNVPSTNSTNKVSRLSLIVACALGLWLFLLYSSTLYHITPPELRSYWTLLGPFAFTLDFLNPVFHSPSAFIESYLLGIGLIVWAVLSLRQRLMWHLMLIACGGIAILFLFVMPLLYGQYQVPIKATAGYEVRWITKPSNQYSSAFKQAQLVHEGECDYHLLGWSPQGELSYRSACLPGIWHYALNTDRSIWSLNWGGAAPSNPTSIIRWDGQQYLSQPSSLTDSAGSPFLTLERAVSADGQWEAVVVRRFYGPSDIVLVSHTR